jgi:hypothetical protein
LTSVNGARWPAAKTPTRMRITPRSAKDQPNGVLRYHTMIARIGG